MGSQCCKCASANKYTSASSAGSTIGTRGDQELSGDRYRFSENNNTVLLSLQHVTEDDVGLYTLIAKNAVGEARRAVELKLDEGGVDAPVFLRRLSDLAVKVGTRTRFLVEIRSSSDIKVTWYHNDHLVQEGERFTFLHEGNFFCVDVAPVMVEDGGRWTCMAENTTGRSSCSSHLNVLVPKAYKSPEFLEELKALLTEQGTVSLECKVVGVPTPVLHWYKDGKEIKAGDIFALTANPDDPTSLGTYTCEAVNCMGKTYSSSRVHVVGKGSREGSLKPADNLRPAGPPPVFSKELLPIKAKIGDTITLACKVTVPPWPKTIVWYNHEGRVDNNDKYHIMEDGLGGYMLEVSPVELVDEGEWKCVATSSEGAMGISKTQVSVSYPKNFRKPRFLESLKAILTEEGLVSFECKVVGFPTPQLRWFKDGQELRPGDVYQLTGTNSLGSYSCIAKNCMGEATSSAELTVEDIQNQLNEEERLQLFSTNQPPKFIQGLKSCEGKINEEFRFTVQVSISPEPTVTWYRDDEHVFDSERYHTSRETLGYCHLDIRLLEIVDQAEWKCVATNEFGHSVTSCFLKLSIPKHFKKPRFLECLRAILSEEGAVNLECKVIGVPQPVLKWYKDGEELKPGDIHRIISGQDGTCCLGTYTCEAHNCMGTVASSASLLGFEDRMLMKTGQQRVDQGIAPAGHIIARNPSLSTIHEERTSQMYDTPATERSLTVDERPEISFSFDGKEVSVSLYETPDLTEEEALQVVEMYADQLSEHVSEHNVVDLPPMRFVKESSHSGKLLMEAVVIDVTGDYFTTAEDDLRTDADVEELSITDDAAQQASALPPDLEEDGIPFDRLNSEFMERALAPTVPYTGSDEVSPPKRPPRRKSENNRITDNEQAKQSSDTYHSISQSKGANGAGNSSQPEDDRSEAFSDAQASEFDTPSKYETFVSARGSIPKMKEEEFAYQVAAIEEQKTVLLSEEQKQASIKSSPPELVRNTQIETKKRKGETTDDGVQLEHSESKVESSTQTGSLKKKVRTVESGQGDSFENILEDVQTSELQKKGITAADLGTHKLEQIREGELSSAEKIDKDDSFSEEGDGLKTRGNVEDGSEDRKDLEEQKARSKPLKRKGSKKVQSEKLETVKSDGKSATAQSQQTAELNDSPKGESATKKKRLSATDLDLPTLPTLEKHPELPKPQAQSSESEVLEALTKSLQDIQKGLTSVEEKVISENIDEPASAISSLSVLETLSQPIHNIQKGLALVEQHSGSSSEEHSIGKTGLILEKLAQPIQEFQRGLELVEEKVFTEKAEESLLERTILQNVAQPVEELKRGMALIQQQAILESVAETPSMKSNAHGITLAPSEKIKCNEKLEALQGLWQSILEIQTGISILQQQALSEVSGELSSESAGMHILTTLDKPLQELKQHATVIEQQIILEDSTDSKVRETEISLEGVYQPIQELQKGLALVEQQAAIEAEDGFEPDIMRCSILKTLSKPIKELEKHLVEIKNTCASDIPLDIYARSSPELQTLEQSIQQLTREIVTIAKLAVLKKKSESDSLATLGNLAPPLLKLQKELVQVERSIVFENLEDPEKSAVSLPSLKKLSFPLTELCHGLSEIKQQLEQDTSEALTPGAQHVAALKALAMPVENLKKGIFTIQQEIQAGSISRPESKPKLESLMKPFQELQRGLVQVEQVVLEVAPELIPQTSSMPVARSLTQCVHALERKITDVQRCTLFDNSDPEKAVISSLGDLAQPLIQLKKTLVQLCLSCEADQPITTKPKLPNLAAAGVLLEPLLAVRSTLDEIEKRISNLKSTEQVKDPSKAELLSMIEPISDIKATIKAVQRQAVIEPTSSKVVVLETLIKPLQTIQCIMQNIEMLASETPRSTVIQKLIQTVGSLQVGIDTIEKNIVSHAEPNKPEVKAFALNALKEPLDELAVELNHVQKEGSQRPEQEKLSEISSIKLLNSLGETLKSFEMTLGDVNKELCLEGTDLTNLQLQSLSESVRSVQKNIAMVQHQAVLESGVVSEHESPSILETLFHPLQMLQKGLVTIESQTVGQICEMSGSKVVELVAQTTHQLEEKVSYLEKQADLKTGLAKGMLSTVGALSNPLRDIQRGLVLIEQQILQESKKEPQSEIANLSALENLVGPLEQLNSDITNLLDPAIVTQYSDADAERKGILTLLQPLSHHIPEVQREIDTIQQKAVMEREPVYGKSQVSILQVLDQPLQDLSKSLKKIEDLKIVVAREEQKTEHLEILKDVSNSIVQLKQKINSIEKCTQGEKVEDPKKQGLLLLGNLNEPLQELSNGLHFLQDQVQNIPVTEPLPEISALHALKDLTCSFNMLEKELTSIKRIALEPMSEQMAKKVRTAAVKAISKSIQELRKEIAVVQQQAVIESGALSISATPSVLETLFKPLQKLQKCLSLIEESKLSTPQTAKLVEMGSVMILETVSHSVDRLTEKILKMKEAEGLKSAEERSTESISKLEILSEPLIALKHGLDIMEYQIIECSSKVRPQSATLCAIETLVKPLHEFVQVLSLSEHVQTFPTENNDVPILETIVNPMLQLEDSIVTIQNQLAIESGDKGMVDEPSLVSIAQPLDDLRKRLLLIKKCPTDQTPIQPLLQQSSFTALKALALRVEELQKNICDANQQALLKSTNVELLQSITEALNVLHGTFSEIEGGIISEGQVDPLSEKISPSVLKAIAVPVERVVKSLVTSEHQTVAASKEVHLPLQTVQILPNELTQAIFEIRDGLIQVENLVVLEAVGEPVSELIDASTAKSLIQVMEKLKCISTPHSHSVSEPRKENISEKIKKSVVISMEQPLTEIEEKLSQIEKHMIANSSGQTLSENVRSAIVEAISIPVEEIQKTLSEITHHILLEIQTEDESRKMASALKNIVMPIHKLQKCLTVMEQGNALETRDWPILQETNESVFCHITQTVKDFQEVINTIKQHADSKTGQVKSESVSDITLTSGLATLAELLQEAQKSIGKTEQHLISEPNEDSISEKTSHSVLQTMAQPLQELQKHLVQVEQVILEAQEEPLLDKQVFSGIKVLAQPVQEIQREIAVVNQQLALEAGGQCISQEESISMLQNVLKPVEDLHNAIALIEQQEVLDTRERSITDETSIAALKAVVKPLQQLHQALATVQQHTVMEPREESMSEKSSLSLLKTLAEPLHELEQHLVQIEQQIPLESQVDISEQGLNLSLLRTLAQPIKEVQQGIAVIEHQTVLEGKGESISDEERLSLLQTLAKPIEEMHRGIAQIEQQVILEGKEESMTERSSITTLLSVAKPIQELHHALASAQEQIPLETREESISEKTNISILKTLAEPLQQLHQHIVQVEHQVPLEFQDDPSSESPSLSLLKALAQPVEEIQRGIAMIEHQTILESKGESISERDSLSILQTLAQPIVELHKGIAQIQQQVLLDAKEEPISEKTDIAALEAVANHIQELYQSIVTMQPQMVFESQEETLSDKTSISILKTLGQPLQELHEHLVQIEQQVVFEPQDEPMSDKSNLSLLKTLAKPVEDIQHGIAMIDHQTALEATGNSISEDKAINVLHALAQPVEELYKCIAKIEHQVAVEAREESMSEKASISILKTLAQPIRQLHQGIITHEQTALEGGEPFSEKCQVSVLQTLAQPVHELLQGLAVIEHLVMMEPKEEPLSEKEDISMLQTLAHPVHEIQQQLVQIEQQITLEAEQSQGRASLDLLHSVAVPLQELKRNIAIIEQHAQLEIGEKCVGMADIPLIKALAKPLQELERGILLISQQEILEGFVEPTSEDGTNFSDLPTLASSKEASQNLDLVNIEEQCILEGDLITISEKPNVQDIKAMATSANEPLKIHALGEQQATFKYEQDSLSDLEGLTSHSISECEEKAGVIIEDGYHKGVAILEEQNVISGAEVLSGSKGDVQKITATVNTVSERGIAIAESQDVLTAAGALESFKELPIAKATIEETSQRCIALAEGQEVLSSPEELISLPQSDLIANAEVKITQLGLATVEQQQLFSGMGEVSANQVSREEADINQVSFLGVPEVQEAELLQEEHVETLSNIESLSKEEYAIESDASLQEAAVIEENEAVMHGSTITSCPVPETQVAKLAETSQREAIELKEVMPLSEAETLIAETENRTEADVKTTAAVAETAIIQDIPVTQNNKLETDLKKEISKKNESEAEEERIHKEKIEGEEYQHERQKEAAQTKSKSEELAKQNKNEENAKRKKQDEVEVQPKPQIKEEEQMKVEESKKKMKEEDDDEKEKELEQKNKEADEFEIKQNEDEKLKKSDKEKEVLAKGKDTEAKQKREQEDIKKKEEEEDNLELKRKQQKHKKEDEAALKLQEEESEQKRTELEKMEGKGDIDNKMKETEETEGKRKETGEFKVKDEKFKTTEEEMKTRKGYEEAEVRKGQEEKENASQERAEKVLKREKEADQVVKKETEAELKKIEEEHKKSAEEDRRRKMEEGEDKTRDNERHCKETEEVERKKKELDELERKTVEENEKVKKLKKDKEEQMKKEEVKAEKEKAERERKEMEMEEARRKEEKEEAQKKIDDRKRKELKDRKIKQEEEERKKKEAEEECKRKEMEEERKRKELEDQKLKEEEERKKKEEEDLKRKKVEEEERKRKENQNLKEEEERKKKEEEECKRKKVEEEERKRKELEAQKLKEEEERKKKEQEERKRKEMEEERKRKELEDQKLKEEEEMKKKEEEERKRKKVEEEEEEERKRKELEAQKLKEEEERKKKEEEERKRKEMEEEERKSKELKDRKLKEEEERKKKEEEELKRKKKKEEEERKRKELEDQKLKEEEERKKKEEEERKRKKVEEEEERKRKELEAQKLKEEEERKKKEEEERKRKEMEEEERKSKELKDRKLKEEEERKKKEEEELKRKKKKEEEERKRKELEDQKLKEEEERKKKEEEERKRKKVEEEEEQKRKELEAQKLKEEEERKKKEQEERKRKEMEEEERKSKELKDRKLKEEEERKKKEEEELKRKKKKEEERKRKELEDQKLKEEEERKKKEEEEHKRNEMEEEERKSKELKDRKLKEEEERKKKEEEELKRKKKKEEEEQKRKELEDQKLKEEEERKKKEEEECKKKKVEEEERKKKELEEQKLKEEERKKKEEEERKRKEMEEEEQKIKVLKDSKLKEEEERKKKEEEELKRKKKEEEEERKKKDLEDRKVKEDNERKKKEEDEYKRKEKEEEEEGRKKAEVLEIERKKEDVDKRKKKEDETLKKTEKENEERKIKEQEELKKRDRGEAEQKDKGKDEGEDKRKKDEEGTEGKKKELEGKRRSVNKRKKQEEVQKLKMANEERDAKIRGDDEDVQKSEREELRKSERIEVNGSEIEKEMEGKNAGDKLSLSKENEQRASRKRYDDQNAKKADISDETDSSEVWMVSKVTQRSRSCDPKHWKEDDSLAQEISLESSDTLTPPDTTSTLTSVQRSKSRHRAEGLEDRSLSSFEELPSDASRRRTGPREKVESGPRDYRKKPVFCTRLTDRTAAQGSRIKLTCSVLGSPDPVVQWLRDGLPLETSSKDKKFRTTCEDGLACLEVLEAAPGDSGEYTCVARNLHGETSSTATLKVYAGFEPAPFPPTFTRAIRDVYRVADDELVLECRVRSQPAPRITWLKNGSPIAPSSRYQQSELADGVCRLTISSPDSVEDSGQYTCRAENALWSDQISSAIRFTGREQHLASRRAERVNGSRVPRDVKRPHFTSVLTDHLVPSGGTIALQVEVKGAPKPEVTWLRGSEQLPPSPKYRTFEEAGVYTLMVADATESEAGMYTCRAYNVYGHMDTSAAVQVVPPGSVRGGRPAMFVSRPDNVMAVAVGEDITVSFRVTGDPKPRVTWMKGTRDITNSQRCLKETLDDYVRLTLKRALPSDVGTYCILAKNVYGCDRSFVTVRIRQRARSLTPGAEVRLQETSIILRDVHDEVERTRLKDVPTAVSAEPVVTDSGRNWLTLSWPKSEHRGGVPVLAYRVEAWELGDAGGARWVELGVSPINSFDAFNLKPGCEYQFRVTPRNRYGWGESVTTSNPVLVGKAVELPEFVRILPGQLKALRGSSIRLECQVRGDPIPQVRWYRDGTELDFRRDNCPRFSTSFNGNLCVLEIKDLQDEDTGRYMCEATNKEGRVSTFARLMVVSDPKIWEADTKLKRGIQEDEGLATDSPPQFTMRLRDRRVQMTYPVRLTCQVAGRPTPELVWSKDGQELKQDERHTFWNEEHFHTLELSHTTLEDSGSYSATARNAHGSVSCRCHLVVDKGIRAYVAPEFIFELEPEYSVKEGGNLRLSAQVEAYPTVGVMWHRDGVRLRPSRRTIMTLNHDGTVELALAGVTARDAGLYSCTATNEVGRCETSGRVAVMVTSPPPAPKPPQVIGPDIPYSKVPLFITKPRSTEAVEGDTVIIHCEVVGDPKPEVMWLRDWLKPDYYRDAPHFRRVGDGPEYRLEIPRAKLDYTGAYSVIARNCHGEAKAVISLQIYAKGQGKEDRMDASSVKHGKVQTLPVIKRELKDLRCCDGDAVTLECRVFATPTPDIRWEKGGRLVPLGGDFSAEFDGETARLSIQQVFPEDEGEYTCVAYNELGRALTSACLVVDVPEEKETLLSRQLSRPPGLLSAGSTPRSTPRTTPTRSKSPSVSRFRDRDVTSLDTGSRPRRLKVVAPKFYAVPHNRVAEEGETVRFQCAIAGHPTPWVTWDKDGLLVTPSARLTLSEKDDLRVLQVEEVTPEDAGLYRVTLENEVGRVEASARLEVIGRHGSRTRGIRAWSASPRTSPTFGRRLIGSAARVGGRLALACDIRGSPAPATTWYRNGEMVVRSERVTPSWDGRTARLEIEALEPEDAGVYTCVAENEAGKTSCSAKVEVLDLNDESDRDRQPPHFLQDLPKDTMAVDGQPLELQVRLQGTSPIDVVWVKDDNEIPDCDDFRYVDYGDGRFALRIADVFPQDAGEYRCEAFSPHGEPAVTCGRLHVHECSTSGNMTGRLLFSKKPSPVVAVPGGSAAFCARLQCDDPAAKVRVSWSVAGRPVLGSSRFKVEEQGDVSILHISGVEAADAGEVTCSARSESGENISCSCELLVQADGDARHTRAMSLSPECDIMSGSYADEATPAEGDGTPAMLLRGPADTTALRGDRVMLKATFVGCPTPNVRWLRAGRELEPNERICITTEDGVSCLALENITADDSGKYVVSVENIFGADCHFASVAVEGPPDPPAGRPSVSMCENGAILTWSSAPYDGGCMVTGFCVEMRQDGSSDWQPIAHVSHSLSYVVRDLTPGDTYVFRVRAENIHGESEPSMETAPFSFQVDLEDECFTPAFEPRLVTVEPGDEFKTKYDVLEELGKGRYGVVHKVVERATSQKFAAKFIRCIKAKDREKVQEEIDIMNCLRHPKLLQLAAAFESPREMVMVMEYISGGELFERVVADDFTLTERDCILFMRQICEGVDYMHQNLVVHLDLKPENIMCHTRTSHQIKLIDFGLARKLQPDTPVRVLFGTPEFIPPEIINYEPIGVESDMWSVGVICYVLLSGLSPFMGDNDAETFANITRADYDFDDEAFDAISQDAKDFISSLLLKRKEKRLTAKECLQHIWLAQQDDSMSCVKLSTDKLKKFIIRRKWQKTGNAIRALGRMATLSAASRRNSNASSTSGSPRPSLSGGGVSRMSSLNEEDQDDKHANHINGFHRETADVLTKPTRMRLCSERSDSGISDCSSITTPTPQIHQPFCQCPFKPLLGKKFSITEEAEFTNENVNQKFISDFHVKTDIHEESALSDEGKESKLENRKGDNVTKVPVSSSEKSRVSISLPGDKPNLLSSSSPAKCVKKTTCLKQQESIDSGVNVDVGGSVMSKVSSYMKTCQQQQKAQKIEMPKKFSKEVTGKVSIASPDQVSAKNKPCRTNPALSTSNEHSTNYQKAMAFWKR